MPFSYAEAAKKREAAARLPRSDAEGTKTSNPIPKKNVKEAQGLRRVPPNKTKGIPSQGSSNVPFERQHAFLHTENVNEKGSGPSSPWKQVASGPARAKPSIPQAAKVNTRTNNPPPGTRKAPRKLDPRKPPKQGGIVQLKSPRKGSTDVHAFGRRKDSKATVSPSPAQYSSDFPALSGAPTVPKQAPKKKPIVTKINGKPRVGLNLAGSKKVTHDTNHPSTRPRKTTKPAKPTTQTSTHTPTPQDFLSPLVARRDEMDNGQELIRMMQDKTVYHKKGKQRLNTRKKRFTALKKKILQERLEKWKELHKEDDPMGQETADSSSSEQDNKKIVCVYNYVDSDEVEDEEELEEVLDNLNDLANGIGETEKTFVPSDFKYPDRYPAFIQFKSDKHALMAKACWQGLLIGGRPLKVELLTMPSNMDGTNWEESALESEEKLHKSGESVVTEHRIQLTDFIPEGGANGNDSMDKLLANLKRLAERYGKLCSVEANTITSRNISLLYECNQSELIEIILALRSSSISGKPLRATAVDPEQDVTDSTNKVVVIQNALSDDDFEDEDCLNETLADLDQIARKYGTVLSLNARGEKVIIRFESSEEASRAFDHLHGMVLGGSKIEAWFDSKAQDALEGGFSIYIHNVLTSDDIADEECLEETLEDVKELMDKYGTIRNVTALKHEEAHVVGIDFSELSYGKIESVILDLQNTTIGGLKLDVTSQLSTGQTTSSSQIDNVEETAETAGRKRKNSDNLSPPKKTKTDDNEPMYSGNKLIPERFAQAKRVPKIQNSTGPRDYAASTQDERVKPLLSEMLGELMRLQKRAAADGNTKAKRRLVMGLREVARGIRSRKVKMIVLANNLDEYGALDTKLQEIIDLSKNSGLPMFYEFTKRSLGKALGKTIKVAVVGIQNADGANQAFKKLVSMAPSL